MRTQTASLAAAVLLAAWAGAAGSPASVTLSPGTLKMKPLGGGGSVPMVGPVIRVRYDRTQRTYLDIVTDPLALPVVLSAKCTSSTFVDMKLEVAGSTLPLDGSGLGKGNGGFSGAKTVTSDTITTRAFDNADVPDPVATCNSDLHALLAAGQQGKAQKGWARRYDNALLARLTVRCKGHRDKDGVWEKPVPTYQATATTRFPVWVHCGPANVFATTGGSLPPAKRSSEVVRKEKPQRLPSDPYRTPGEPHRVPTAPDDPGVPEPLPDEPSVPADSVPGDPTDTADGTLPDLLVTDARLAPTAPTKLRVQVSNQGTDASLETRLTLYYERGGNVQQATVDVLPLGPSESRWIIVDAGASLALADHLTLRVDDPPLVPELDESNNSFTVR